MGIEIVLLPRDRMPYKHHEPRRHKTPEARYKVSGWPEHDQALQQRSSLTVWVRLQRETVKGMGE